MKSIEDYGRSAIGKGGKSGWQKNVKHSNLISALFAEKSLILRNDFKNI
jgi:hypothetical protein